MLKTVKGDHVVSQEFRAVPPDAKRQALDLLLKSKTLTRAERLRNLLRFVCEAEIEGREVNEYTIGVEALGRSEGYSPIEDSSVRSRTCELRQKLDRFYTEEAPDTSVRVLLPKGSHIPLFVFQDASGPSGALKGSVQPEPSSPALRPRAASTQWLAFGSAAFALGLLVMWLVRATWAPTVSPATSGSVARSSAGLVDPAWTPDLEAIWAPLLGPDMPVLISFETRLFLKAGEVMVRDGTVNDISAVTSSEALMRIKQLFGIEQLVESKNYTDTGAAEAIFLLASRLGTRAASLALKRSGDVTGDEMRTGNLIFLGKPAADPNMRSLLRRAPIMDYGDGHIRLSDPQPGEVAEYRDQWETDGPDRWGEKYAVISMLPGAARGRRILSLAGAGSEHLRASAQYITTPNYARQMVERVRLSSGKLPDFYQVLVRMQFRFQSPTQIQ